MGLSLDYIYGQTGLEEEELEALLIKTISTRGELDEFEQQNIETAVEWSLKQKLTYDKILIPEFIMDLHRRMYDRVWGWAGSFRDSNKNIGVDKFLIPQKLKLLLDDCDYWIKNEIFPEDEIAIRFKHRLVQIHPFPNGNGRHSRLCADILVSHAFNRPVFTWGRFDLTIPGEKRQLYLDALHTADSGDLEPLIHFARS
jgi:Fic-DOC domain mobile mystery protein B